MPNLFLDDARRAPFGWDVVRNYAAFVEYIQTHEMPSVISFDHDLGFEHYPLGEQDPGKEIPYESYSEKTGYDAAKWLVSYAYRGPLSDSKFPDLVIVHSWNVVGARNIAKVLAPYTAVRIEAYDPRML